LCSPVLWRGRGGRPESRLPVTGWLTQSDGMARAAMGWLGQRSWRGKNISHRPAATRQGGGPQRPIPGEVTARRRSNGRPGVEFAATSRIVGHAVLRRAGLAWRVGEEEGADTVVGCQERSQKRKK
jgi:hypothetical protein